MAEIQHTIKAVARKSGLSAHVIRAWEKRYGAVKPQRTGTNRRFYSEEEMHRLELLHRATQAGHSISHLAKLSTDKVRQLLSKFEPGLPPPAREPATAKQTDEALLADCLDAIKEFDTTRLEKILQRAVVRLGHMGFLTRIAAPLGQQVGEEWCVGKLTAAHEHFSSAALRTFLGQSVRQFASTDPAPVLLVATPAGQLHELGAMIVAAAAADLGWRVSYLGASLPAAEIAGAAIQNRARAVALSIVYPQDDRGLPLELSNLRRYLPLDIQILAGGRAAVSYREALNAIGALHIESLESLATTLTELRQITRAQAH